MSETLETTGPGAVDPRAEQRMVPMRDGVTLATDVYLPDEGRPRPAVLVRLPYDKNGRYCWMPQIARHFTDRGYVFLVQDVRGKFRSGGEVNAFVHEIDDGYDTLEWITGQPWSDGAVGMWGDSYYGFVQWTAVASGHPALRAIVPRVTVADLFDWLAAVTPLYGAHYLAQYWSDSLTHHWTPDWTHRPLCELFDDAFAAIGSRSIAFDRILAEERGQAGVDLYAGGHPFDRLRIPTLHGVGWFDNITPPHMLDYERLMADPERRRTSTSTRARPTTRTTGSRTSPWARPTTTRRTTTRSSGCFPAISSPRSTSLTRSSRVAATLGPCRACAGISETTAGTSRRRGRRRGRARRGSTSRRRAASEPTRAYPARWPGCTTRRIWSRRRSSTRSRSCSSTPTSRDVAARADVAVFTGQPLAEPLTLAGRVVAHLAVGSDGPSMCVHVKLVDVAPDGASHILLYGQELVDRPGDSAHVEVYLGHTGHRVLPGHRLRLQVASSDYPLYVPHPGTSESPWFAVETAVNHQRVLTGGPAPSHVSVTLLGAVYILKECAPSASTTWC